MTLPPRNRPPIPLPGSPEALKNEEERTRIIMASKAQTGLLMPTPSQLKPLPELPQSTRLATIPTAQFGVTSFTGPSGAKYPVPDMETVPVATGNKPAAEVQHQWDDVDSGRPGQQPGWLNTGGRAIRTCKVCGVTERNDLIRTDRKGMGHHYVDVYGVAMTSVVELFCPTFIGDTNGTLGEAKQRVRGLDIKMETVEARLDRLEQDNQYLREQLEAKINLDVTGLVEWLSQMAKLSAEARLPTTSVTVAGLGLEVPTPVADLVRGVGEAVTVDLQFEEDPDPESNGGVP